MNAGATPKLIMSVKESSSLPTFDVPLINLAILPSNPSINAAKIIAIIANSNFSSSANLIEVKPMQTGELCKEAMTFAKDILELNGYFVSKIFMGGTFNEIVAEGKKFFKDVKVFKPKSSRKDSKESFIICQKLR